MKKLLIIGLLIVAITMPVYCEVIPIITTPQPPIGTGTVTQVNTGEGLIGGPIITTGILSVDSTVMRTSGSQSLTTTGIITADAFFGDGQNLTGIGTAGAVYFVELTGDTMTGPLTVSATSSFETIYQNGSTLDDTYVDVAGDTITGTLTLDVIDSSGQLTILDGITVEGVVTAEAYHGDGSTLTGVLLTDVYVDEAGDTMTGILTIDGTHIDIDSASQYGTGMNIDMTGVSAANYGLDINISGSVSENRGIVVDADDAGPYCMLGTSGHSSGASYGVAMTLDGTGSENYCYQGTANGAATTNYSFYADSSGGTTNYAFYANQGKSLFKDTFITGDLTVSAQVSAEGYIIGANILNTSEWAYLDGTNQALQTGSTVTFDDATISSPSNIYLLSHNSWADYAANEHIDWTSATDDFLTTGNASVGGWVTAETFVGDGSNLTGIEIGITGISSMSSTPLTGEISIEGSDNVTVTQGTDIITIEMNSGIPGITPFEPQYGNFHSTTKQDCTSAWVEVGYLSKVGHVVPVGVTINPILYSGRIIFAATGIYEVTYMAAFRTPNQAAACRAMIKTNAGVSSEVVGSHVGLVGDDNQHLTQTMTFLVDIENTGDTVYFEITGGTNSDLDYVDGGANPTTANVFATSIVKIGDT